MRPGKVTRSKEIKKNQDEKENVGKTVGGINSQSFLERMTLRR